MKKQKKWRLMFKEKKPIGPKWEKNKQISLLYAYDHPKFKVLSKILQIAATFWGCPVFQIREKPFFEREVSRVPSFKCPVFQVGS